MLSQKEAEEILYQSEFEESRIVLDRKLAHASKAVRQRTIKGDKNSTEAESAAAIEIQRVWRGYNTRSNVFNIAHPDVSKTAVYSGSKHLFMRQEDFLGYTGSGKEKSGARMKLEDRYGSYLRRLIESGYNPNKLPTFENFCAMFIQDWWRRMWQKVLKHRAEAAEAQRQLARRLAKVLTPREAASLIQRAWRRHIDIQVYRYYRDLINFKSRGNPALMLRCINPQEAKMLDVAAGIHVKFRLAGERFPPNIYYKIFTHRPIQDMCANSPKDYTKATVKLKMAKDQHNITRNSQLPQQQDYDGWYQRMDNNGWRLVSDRLIPHIMDDAVTWRTSSKKYEYSHDKLQRKQDVEKRKKKKKIEWMQKMYKEGMLKAKSDDKETIQLIEGAAAGMVATVENFGPDALEDWEVDELLDWTTSLNFEDYQNSWKELATSANSEKQMAKYWNRRYTASEDRVRLFTSTADPYEFTLSTAPSHYQSTQHSRNTPVSSTGSPTHMGVVNG